MYVKVCLFDRDVVSHEEVEKSVGSTEDYLSNLKERQGLLHGLGDSDGKRGESVVGVLSIVSDLTLPLSIGYLSAHHDRVQERIDKDEHPNWWRHVTNPGPHAQHSASMMERLEYRAFLAFGEDDCGIEHLVEFRKVEKPSVESEALIPDPAHVC